MLPSTDADAVRALVSTLKENSRVGDYAITCILARYGDSDATQRLLSTAEALTENSSEGIRMYREALGYVPTREVMLALARGLRSEVMISFAGGGKAPQRNLYVGSLVMMMRDDRDFPEREGRYYRDDQPLDLIEAWCTRHLGVKFPAEPRKRLVSLPSMGEQPLPDGKPSGDDK